MASAAPVVAVSPIVAGAALRGPADAMLVSLQGEASAHAVARHYATEHPGLVDDFVIDTADVDAKSGIEALGLRTHVAPTVMRADADRESLAVAVLACGTEPDRPDRDGTRETPPVPSDP